MSFYAIVIWLVASTQAIVNLMAIWAIRPQSSTFCNPLRRKLILRWFGFPLVLSLLVLVPAYEVIFVYLIQYVMVSLAAYFFATKLYGCERVQKDALPAGAIHPRFNLGFLFVGTAVVAAVVALVRAIDQTIDIGSDNWMCLLAISVSSSMAGILFLIGHGICQHFLNRSKYLLGVCWCSVGFASILSYSLAAWKDNLVASLVDEAFAGWPLDTTLFTFERPSLIWFAIGAVTSLLVIPLGFLLVTRRLNRLRLIVPICLILLPLPTWIAVQLLHPKPILRSDSADNCYTKLRSIASAMGDSPLQATAIQCTDWDAMPNQFKRQYLAEMEPMLQQVIDWEGRDCFVPLRLSYEDLDDLSDIRELARCYNFVGQIEMDRDPDAACDRFVQGCVVTNRLRDDGLLVHDLVGIASLAHLLGAIAENRRYFSADKAKSAAAKLLDSINAVDSTDEFIYRDELWSRNVSWFSSLQWILADLTRLSPLSISPINKDLRLAELADVRLCCIGLIMESFHRSHGHYPESLKELDGELPATALHDPFSSSQQHFHYHTTPTGYVLYSVGVNRTDDGGTNGSTRLDGDIVLK